MKNEVVKYASTTSAAKFNRFRVAVLLAPFAASSLAGAQTSGIDTLTSKATDGGDSVQAAVLTIAGIVVTIGLLIWGATKLKPRG